MVSVSGSGWIDAPSKRYCVLGMTASVKTRADAVEGAAGMAALAGMEALADPGSRKVPAAAAPNPARPPVRMERREGASNMSMAIRGLVGREDTAG